MLPLPLPPSTFVISEGIIGTKGVGGDVNHPNNYPSLLIKVRKKEGYIRGAKLIKAKIKNLGIQIYNNKACCRTFVASIVVDGCIGLFAFIFLVIFMNKDLGSRNNGPGFSFWVKLSSFIKCNVTGYSTLSIKLVTSTPNLCVCIQNRVFFFGILGYHECSHSHRCSTMTN